MIDFHNANFFKLQPVSNDDFSSLITPMFVEGEQIIQSFKGLRDGVVFTNKRIIAINVKNFTGARKDISSLPYSKIQAYSIETAGVIDLDSDLELRFSGLGKVKFEFIRKADITSICRIISKHVL